MTVERVRDFTVNVDKWISEFHEKQWQEVLGRQIGHFDPEVQQELLETWGFEVIERTEGMRRTFHYSAVMMLFTAVEHGLRVLSEAVERRKNMPFKPHELNGLELDRYQKVLLSFV